MTASFAVVIATYGDQGWAELARERALASLEEQDAEEVVLRHEPGGSLAGARNTAAASVRSTHLVFLDADDELAPDYLDALRRAHSVLTAPSLERDRPRFHRRPALLVPRVQEVREVGRSLRESPPEFPNRQRPMEELNHCVIGTAVPTEMFRRAGGFRDDLPAYEDWALFLACKRLGARLVDVPGAVYRAWMRPGSRNEPRRDTRRAYDLIRREHAALSP